MPLPRDLSSGRFSSLAPLFLRIPVGVHLVHGTQDNIFSWTRMLEFRDFLGQHGFPFPIVCAVVSVAAQFIAGLLFIVGYRTREAATLMTLNFLIALFGVHVAHGHSYAATFPAIFMLAASLSLLFSGPGALAIDRPRTR